MHQAVPPRQSGDVLCIPAADDAGHRCARDQTRIDHVAVAAEEAGVAERQLAQQVVAMRVHARVVENQVGAVLAEQVGEMRRQRRQVGEFTAEGRVPMTLLWQKVGPIDDQINTSVQIFDADGTALTQADGPPARGMTTTFDFDRVVLPDPKQPLLPANLAPGRYRIDVVAYRVTDGALLSEPVAVAWFQIGPPPAPPTVAVNAAWQDGIVLVGHDDLPATLQPGDTVNLRLVWRADAKQSADYTVFVHLLDVNGQIVAQHDRAPENGFYATSQWHVGETVADDYALVLPETLAPGAKRLVAGLYDPATGQRLFTAEGRDAVELAAWPAP